MYCFSYLGKTILSYFYPILTSSRSTLQAADNQKASILLSAIIKGKMCILSLTTYAGSSASQSSIYGEEAWEQQLLFSLLPNMAESKA
jgi:hypothetical protein